MLRSLALSLILALPIVATAAPAPSRARPSRTPAVTADRDGWIAIGGVPILQLRDKSVCTDVRQRNERITARLVNALEKINRDKRWADITITVEPPEKEPWIVIEGVRVMKVTTEDISALRQIPGSALAAAGPAGPPTPEEAKQLAQQYADHFRKALRRVYAR